MKQAPTKPKKKSLIKAGVRIDNQFRHLAKPLVDELAKLGKKYGYTRGDAIRQVVKDLQDSTNRKNTN